MYSVVEGGEVAPTSSIVGTATVGSFATKARAARTTAAGAISVIVVGGSEGSSEGSCEGSAVICRALGRHGGSAEGGGAADDAEDGAAGRDAGCSEGGALEGFAKGRAERDAALRERERAR